ncbi:MAG: hypothetical protein Q7S76_03745 [bacterium]|nr:hypothetical protein [bacterium]
MKGFYIEVSNDLLDPRHCKQMGDAVWLFMWFLDKMTAVTEKKGKVLGGKPIKFKDIQDDLGISRSTFNRWMKVLKDGGYVQTVRTPYGSCVIVLKAKKRFNNKPSDVSEVTHPVRSIINETSPAPEMTHQSSDSDTSLPLSSSDNDTSNKTRQNTDNTEDKAIVPSGPDEIGSDSVTNTNSEDTIGKNVNDAIALFLPYFPGDFVGKSSAFAKKPTRRAVEALLKRYSLDELKELLRKYDSKKTDKFRPEAGTVYEFCTFKLAKIESFLQKDGALWAQRSISTPEQRADSDSLINKKLEAGRERMRKAKEEWTKDHPTE